MNIGVLALQGDFQSHVKALKQLNVQSKLVKQKEDLEGLDALIIPGGESTVMNKLLSIQGMTESLKYFLETKPVFGTCAGLILLQQFGAFPEMKIERNFYGSQLESFVGDLNGIFSMKGVFIRAPKIIECKDTILLSLDGEPVAVKRGNKIGICFHPELTNDIRLHEYFISVCMNKS